MIEIYIGSERLDTFKDEDVNIKLSLQNVKDISKLFTDYTQNFQVPASKSNNAVFKHYYNCDISGGFNASLRQDATLFVNKEVFREGSIELLSVDMKDGKPSAYEVVFFSAGVNLKDLFGEDELTDLDLSAYDHAYTDANILLGIKGKTLLSGNVIYPMISAKDDWYYDSGSHTAGDSNLFYHSGSGSHDHGAYYYDFKPALKIAKIIDAIESKYSITFTSDFFADSKFTDLYLWGHRREGYMFKDQELGFTAQKIDFISTTGTGFDLTNDNYVVQSGITRFIWRYTISSSSNYQIHFYKNGEYYTSRSHSGNVTDEDIFITQVEAGDEIQMRFSPPIDWDGSAISISNITASGRQFDNPLIQFWDASRTASQSFTTNVEMSDQMPEMKVYDFMLGLVKMFNLVIDPVSRTKFNIEPLDDWYADGSNYDITEHVDITSMKVVKPELHRRIELKYQEANSELMNSYRLTNGDRGYGDLRADFTFDASELSVQNTFELMRYQDLIDLDDGSSVGFPIGKSIDKELKAYIGAPVIFYSASTLTNLSFSYMGVGGKQEVRDVNQVSNVNSRTASSVTQTLTYGLEIDPFLKQSFSETLYNQFWEDYITDLYSSQRRVYQMKAILPFNVSSRLKMNDKLDINGRRYVINEIQINLRTDEATLELLNDV